MEDYFTLIQEFTGSNRIHRIVKLCRIAFVLPRRHSAYKIVEFWFKYGNSCPVLAPLTNNMRAVRVRPSFTVTSQ